MVYGRPVRDEPPTRASLVIRGCIRWLTLSTFGCRRNRPATTPGLIDVEATASAAGDSGRAEPAGRGTVRADRADPEMSGQPARPETPALEQRNTVYGSGAVVSVQGGDLTFYQRGSGNGFDGGDHPRRSGF